MVTNYQLPIFEVLGLKKQKLAASTNKVISGVATLLPFTPVILRLASFNFLFSHMHKCE